jgi:hypothetical protein
LQRQPWLLDKLGLSFLDADGPEELERRSLPPPGRRGFFVGPFPEESRNRHPLDVGEAQEAAPMSVGEDRLKAAIISRLLTLAADGTPQQDWKSKVLSTLLLQ